jgi:hypothetical protein
MFSFVLFISLIYIVSIIFFFSFHLGILLCHGTVVASFLFLRATIFTSLPLRNQLTYPFNKQTELTTFLADALLLPCAHERALFEGLS